VHKKLQEVFSRSTEEGHYTFELLRRAYLEARYNKDYTITPKELHYLSSRILFLKDLVEQLCQQEIARLTQACKPTAS
jgi:hypothetical protein